MQVVLLWFITAFFFTMAQDSNDNSDIENSDVYLYVSDDHNNMRRVYGSQKPNQKVLESVIKGQRHVKYYLYTRKNAHDAQELVYENLDSIIASNFDPIKVTVFVIHGWLGDRNSTVNTLLTEAFLQDGDVNVIVVDWCEIACSKNYFTVVASVPAVGQQVANFIKWLVTMGSSFEKVHAVGHSLGAHVAGNAGRDTEGKVQRITGLDPAGPFWEDLSYRLNKSDAQYVEIIHTNSDCLGYKYLCGDADFFPNGGNSMPGCIKSSCSHSKSYYYMADTVKYNNMSGLPCANMDDMRLDKCEGNPYLMGNSDLSKNRSGIFRLDTTDEALESVQKNIPYRRYMVNQPEYNYDCKW